MENYRSLVDKQHMYFRTGATKDITFRLNALQKLKDGINHHERRFMEALKADLNKSEFEAYSTEIGIVLEELRFTMKHLRKWAKPKRVKTPITHIGSTGYIYPEPYGVAMIISPWNYPFQLAIGASDRCHCRRKLLNPEAFRTNAENLRSVRGADRCPLSGRVYLCRSWRGGNKPSASSGKSRLYLLHRQCSGRKSHHGSRFQESDSCNVGIRRQKPMYRSRGRQY